MIATTKKIRINNWWLDLLRHMMGLTPGEYVIVLRVFGDGRRSVSVARCDEVLQ